MSSTQRLLCVCVCVCVCPCVCVCLCRCGGGRGGVTMKEMGASASSRVIPLYVATKKNEGGGVGGKGVDGEVPTSQLVKPEGHQLISREALSLSGRDPLISYAHW